MRKMRITSSTSIIGIKLISGSSRPRPRWKFMGCLHELPITNQAPSLPTSLPGEGRRLIGAALWAANEVPHRRSLAFSVNKFHQLHCLQFHLDHEAVHQGAKMAVEDHAGDGNDQPEAGVVKRYGNSMRQGLRIVA